MTPAPLTIRLFGTLRVTVRGEPLPRVRTRTVEWLLALLTLRHGRAVNRAWLAGTLWPESSGSRSLQNLRNELVRLRQALGPESGRLQAPAQDCLLLDLTGASVDVLEFDAAIQEGDEAGLQRAVAVYTAPLLEECSEEWAFTERATRAEQFLAAVEALAEKAAGRGDHGEAIRYLRRAQTLDPLRDSLVRQLMGSLAAAGDPAAAIQTYRDFRIRLQEELAAAPDEATTRFFHEIRAATRHHAVQRRLTPEPASAATVRDARSARRLPLPLTSLIGREQEVGEIQSALGQDRLVTLIGGGGVGKTRLALEVALQASAATPDGAAWVELAPLADGALVLPSVAAARGIRDEGGDPTAEALTDRLIALLAEEAPLLVLDNCEHLLEATASLVLLLLQRCPELRVLATSRQRLGLPGEVTWRVPSLSVPDPERLPAAEGAAVASTLEFAAVRLFVERAVAVQPRFRLASGAEAAAVSQICRRLDGIPLAIELAAARVRILTPQQIAARLDDRFSLLTGGTRGALPRHQTLRALIDWSYDSLPEAEAALLRRLSVFVGGWTLEAAEAIGGTDGRRSGVLDLLDALVDRSLVLVDEVNEGLRYRMLETVREYARERLVASGEQPAVRDRHRDWYLQLAEQAEAKARGPERKADLKRLAAELDNLRAALAWCQEAAEANPVSGTAEVGLRVAGALYLLLRTGYGHLMKDAALLEAALLRNAGVSASARAGAFDRAARLAGRQGKPASARSYFQLARQGYEEVLTQARAEGDRSGIAAAVLGLANVTSELGDMDAAWSSGVEAHQRMAELGDRVGFVQSVECLARVAVARSDLGAARPLLEERLAVCRELGDSHLLIHALGMMGHLERDEGDFAGARSLYSESLVLRRALDERFPLAQGLEDLAVLAGCEQQCEGAIRLLGASEAFCETLGARPPVAMAAEYERTMTEGRAALGEAAFAAAWAEGRAMSLEQAIDLALLAPHDPLRPPES